MYNCDHAVITISNYVSASKQPTQKTRLMGGVTRCVFKGKKFSPLGVNFLGLCGGLKM